MAGEIVLMTQKNHLGVLKETIDNWGLNKMSPLPPDSENKFILLQHNIEQKTIEGFRGGGIVI